MISGTVLRYEQRNMFIDLGKAEAILPLSEQVPHESFRIGSRVRVYVMEARKTNKGPQIVVSRTHPNVVRRLFETGNPGSRARPGRAQRYRARARLALQSVGLDG